MFMFLQRLHRYCVREYCHHQPEAYLRNRCESVKVCELRMTHHSLQHTAHNTTSATRRCKPREMADQQLHDNRSFMHSVLALRRVTKRRPNNAIAFAQVVAARCIKPRKAAIFAYGIAVTPSVWLVSCQPCNTTDDLSENSSGQLFFPASAVIFLHLLFWARDHQLLLTCKSDGRCVRRYHMLATLAFLPS